MTDSEGKPYTIDEHRHRFCAWTAGRAASVKGFRFKVEHVHKILKKSGFTAEFIASPDNLPTPENMDLEHSKWRKKVIAAAKKNGYLCVTHGIAAKLINVYLKAAFVCGGYHNHERVCALHPPIDSLLLNALAKKGFAGKWDFWNEIAWSKFGSKKYQKVIDNIRIGLAVRPLWEIEKDWRAHR